MPNATIEKFGYPQTLLREYAHWVVLLRPAQVTLGALVLAARSDATAYSNLPPEAFEEQGRVVAEIERALGEFTRYERLNYLMLMMVDPHVHFHVLPRYAEPREWNGIAFADAGWPGVPDLKSAAAPDARQSAALASEMRKLFAAG